MSSLSKSSKNVRTKPLETGGETSKASDQSKKKHDNEPTQSFDELPHNLEDNDVNKVPQSQDKSAMINDLFKQIVNLICEKKNKISKDDSQFQNCIKRLNSYDRETSSQLNEIYTNNIKINQYLNDLTNENNSMKKHIEQNESDKKQLQFEIQQLKNEKRQLQYEGQQLKNDKRQLQYEGQHLKDDKKQLQSEVQQLKNYEKQLLSEVQQLKNDKRQLQYEGQQLKDDKKQLQSEVQQLKTYILNLESRIQSILGDIPGPSQERYNYNNMQPREDSNQQLDQIRDAIISMKNFISNLIEQLHTYSGIINEIIKNKTKSSQTQEEKNFEGFEQQFKINHDQLLQYLNINTNYNYVQEFDNSQKYSINKLKEINENNIRLNMQNAHLSQQISYFRDIITFVYSKRTEKNENNYDKSDFESITFKLDREYKDLIQQIRDIKNNNLYLNIYKLNLEEQIYHIKKAVKAIFDNKVKTETNDKKEFKAAIQNLEQTVTDLIKSLQSVPGYNITESKKNDMLYSVKDLIYYLEGILDTILLSNSQVRIFKFCINYIRSKIDDTPKKEAGGDKIKFANEIKGLAKELKESGEQLHAINDKIHKSNDKINLLKDLIIMIDKYKDKDRLDKNEIDKFDNLKTELADKYREIIEASICLGNIKENVIRLNDGKNQMEKYIIHVLTSIRELYSKLDVKDFYDSSSKFEVQVMTNAINIYKNGDTGSSYPSRVDIDGNYSRLSSVQDKLYELTKPIEFSSHFHDENQKIVNEKIEQKDSKYGTNSEINPTGCFAELAECISSLMKDKKDSFTEILHLRKIVRKQMILAKNENELQIDKVRLIQNNEIDAIIRVLT